jgi:hypothetical protein
MFNVAATVVFACGSENLEAVYVEGEKLVYHLVLTSSDMAGANAEIETHVGRMRTLAQKK